MMQIKNKEGSSGGVVKGLWVDRWVGGKVEEMRREGALRARVRGCAGGRAAGRICDTSTYLGSVGRAYLNLPQ